MADRGRGRGRGSGGPQDRGGPSRGGRGDSGGSRGDSRGGRGDFHGGRGRGQGGGYGGGGNNGDPIFESGSIPQPDTSIEAWENKLASDVAAGMQALTTSDKKTLPLRPGYGTQGRKIVVRVNFFPLDIVKKDITLYRYELSILPKTGSGQSEDDGTKKMAKVRRRQFVTIMMTHPMFSNVHWATDYSKLIITDQKLKLVNDEFASIDVPYHDPEEEPLLPPSPNEAAEITQRRKHRSRKIRIVPAGELSSLSVSDLLKAVASGRQNDYYAGKDEIIQAYNIIINNAVLRTPQNPQTAQVGQNKFFPYLPGPLMRNQDLQEGLEALRGYFTSLRIGANRLLLNVNVASGAFYKAQSLPDNVNEFAGSDRSESMLRRLRTFLKGLRIKTQYLKEKNNDVVQVKKIYDIAPKPMGGGPGGNAVETTFKWDDNGNEVNTNVQEFFKRKHGITLRNPTEFLVNCGTKEKPAFIPIELCWVVAGQPSQRLLSGYQTSQMIRFAARPPNQNAISITTDGLQLLKIKDQQARQNTHGQWGIQIQDKMITVNARILPPPTIGFRGKPVNTRDGTWNFNGLKFIKGVSVPSWMVLYVRAPPGRNQENMNQQSVGAFAEFAKKQVQSYGISMPDCSTMRAVSVPKLSFPNRTAVDNAIIKEFQVISNMKPKPKLVWVIIPERDIHLKARIKFYGDVKAGVQTMLIREENVLKQNADAFANEAAKMNLRFGGTCWEIDSMIWKPLDETYMLMGIDVTHPSPGSGEGAPSVAAVVATIDRNFAQYRGRVYPQGERVEMVAGLKTPVQELLQLWRKNNQNRLPKNILVYRDGVSEGQYQDVLSIEVPAIEKAFVDLYGKEQNWPNLSVVVVTKRHHVRFFPTSKNDAAGRMDNCRPGTVVDRGITGGGSQLWDTYLQAHQGIQGHARSARYIFLRHGIQAIKVDDFERITNSLCYMWQRAPRSVSYAPPAYYADLLAERGRAYLIRYLNDPEGNERYDASRAEWTGNIHEDVRDTMFFV